jgi:hypothetical protein
MQRRVVTMSEYLDKSKVLEALRDCESCWFGEENADEEKAWYADGMASAYGSFCASIRVGDWDADMPKPPTVTLGDGTAARVGDMVMTPVSKRVYTVLASHADSLWLGCHDGNVGYETIRSESLVAYVEPDSWDKLEADVGQDMSDATVEQAEILHDILIRAKKLAEVE